MRVLKSKHQLIVTLSFLTFVTCLLNSFTEDTENEFKKLKFHNVPDSLSRYNMHKLCPFINPNKEYKYWQISHVHHSIIQLEGQVDYGKVSYFRGDSCKYKKIADTCCTNEIFPVSYSDAPIDGYYIVAVNDSDKTEVIDKDKAEKFVGKIDNKEEAYFVLYLHGFHPYAWAETDSTYLFQAGYHRGVAKLRLFKKGRLQIISCDPIPDSQYGDTH